MINPTLKRRKTILFFLIVVINGLKCIVSDIRLDTCARERWRVEVSKVLFSFSLCYFYYYCDYTNTSKKILFYFILCSHNFFILSFAFHFMFTLLFLSPCLCVHTTFHLSVSLCNDFYGGCGLCFGGWMKYYFIVVFILFYWIKN